MSVHFCSAGDPPVATTFTMCSAICVAVRELPDDFVARLIVVFQRTAGVRFTRANIPSPLLATSAPPLSTFLVAIAIVRADEDPLRRVMGPAEKTAEAGSGGDAHSARSCLRGEVSQGGIQRERSASGKARGRKKSAELQAEIVAAADALANSKRSRVESSALADFEAALNKREEAFGRDAVIHFVFIDQIEYDGAGYAEAADDLTRA